MITIDKYHNLLQIKNKEKGELALVEENHTVYEYTGKKWTKKDLQTDSESGQKLTLYGINKMIIPQIPTLSDEQIENKKNDIKEYVNKDGYYLLLSKNIGYYTFLNVGSNPIPPIIDADVADEVIACLQDNGEIKSIEWADDDKNAIEFWVCDVNNNAEPYYLIDWTEGTIECKR